MYLKQNNLEGFIGAPSFIFLFLDFLSFKKRPNNYKSVRRILAVDFSRILSLLIRSVNFTQNDLCATSAVLAQAKRGQQRDKGTQAKG